MAQQKSTILMRAIYRDDIETIRLTLEANGFPDEHLDYDLLIKSLQLGRKRIVNFLLDKGCSVIKPDSSITPLHIAVKKVGWSSIVLKLLARGARVANVINGNFIDNTPIHVAFANNTAGVVIDLLLRHYVRETFDNVINQDGLGLIHIACARPHLDLVKGFVEVGGSNIYSQVYSHCDSVYAGYSPLHFAVENARHNTVKFLCECEADIGAFNRKGLTPLHLALYRCDLKMIDILFHYADWNENYIDEAGVSHFMGACVASDPEIVKQYVRIAADKPTNALISMVTAQVKDLDNCSLAGYTPMHFAAEFGCIETVQLLLDQGAHCTLTSGKFSPLDLARKRNGKSVCSLLEQHCLACTTCKNLIADCQSETIIETNKVSVDINCNETKLPIVLDFDTRFTENHITSLDESCFIDISPLPDKRLDGKSVDDCDLCQLQELHLYEDRVNRWLEDSCNRNKSRQITRINNSIRSYNVKLRLPERYSIGQVIKFLFSSAACICIVTIIFFISQHQSNSTPTLLTTKENGAQ